MSPESLSTLLELIIVSTATVKVAAIRAMRIIWEVDSDSYHGAFPPSVDLRSCSETVTAPSFVSIVVVLFEIWVIIPLMFPRHVSIIAVELLYQGKSVVVLNILALIFVSEVLTFPIDVKIVAEFPARATMEAFSDLSDVFS